MSKSLLKALAALSIGAASVCPMAALAYDGAAAIPSTAGRVEVLLAYIDPGAAGFIIVSVLGFISAIGYTTRSYLSRLKRFVLRGGRTAQERKSCEGRCRRGNGC